MAGGLIGSWFGAARYSVLNLRRALAFVLLLAAARPSSAVTAGVGWARMTAPQERSRTSFHGSAALRLVGADTEVPLVTGGTRRYVNLDYAASAPALRVGPPCRRGAPRWYSSVHRGAGFKSRASTAAYEGARESIRRFVNARDDDAVIITRNTTDSINLLAGTLPEGTHVVAFAGEHHANLLPWQRIGVPTCPCPSRRPRRSSCSRRPCGAARPARTRTWSR